MDKKQKIASSGTIEGLQKLINEFYFSNTYYIKDMKVYNKNGVVDKIEIISEKGRFIARFV